jgi:hypothetical protein
MTMQQADENAIARIQSKEQALSVASEMLDRIQDGKSYDSFEFIALANRIREYVKSEPLKVTLSAKSAHAVQKYGLGECVKAYTRNQEGYGASTIAFENHWKTNQANAAINAGQEYIVFTTGHELPYGPQTAASEQALNTDWDIHVNKHRPTGNYRTTCQFCKKLHEGE